MPIFSIDCEVLKEKEVLHSVYIFFQIMLHANYYDLTFSSQPTDFAKYYLTGKCSVSTQFRYIKS